MACCLTAPSQYLNQWLFIICNCKAQWNSSRGNFTWDTSAISCWISLGNYLSKISFKSPRGRWVKWCDLLCSSFSPGDSTFLYGVFDGHEASRVSHFAAQRMPAEILLDQLSEASTDDPDFNDKKVNQILHQVCWVGLVLPTEISSTSIRIMPWISNDINVKLWDVISYSSCRNVSYGM